MNNEDKNWIRKEILTTVLDHMDHAEKRLSDLISRNQDSEKSRPPTGLPKGRLQVFNADGTMNKDPLGEEEDD